MHPILFHIGGITIHTYGVFVATGFALGLLLAVRSAKRAGVDPNKIIDLSVYILIAAIIGSRVLYVFVNWRDFRSNLFEAFYLWKGGLVFYGGFIGAASVAFWYMRRHALPVWKTVDILAPSIALGQSIGRIGCFSAGCCYGKPCDNWWRVTFSHPQTLAPIGVPLHPTQLYDSAGTFLIFLALIVLQKRKKIEGEVFCAYAIMYAGSRFIVEMFRGDDRGPVFLGGLSLSQMIAVFVAMAGVSMLFYLVSRKAPQQSK
ncbi:MAG: prolipoprotein diacylglyceryl transferase [Pseudomonadota bacterium]